MREKESVKWDMNMNNNGHKSNRITFSFLHECLCQLLREETKGNVFFSVDILLIERRKRTLDSGGRGEHASKSEERK